MRQKQSGSIAFRYLIIFVTTFGYVQWFFAEQDNEELKQQLMSIKFTQGDGHEFNK
ncbi:MULTISPECIES: hypothetical protein [Acinetobacter]|jgi:hypothetical protein|uniref:hypothetical protein n=1 Tax=Acinetobacter TaxID=469 RepID=UPI0002BB585B|nr:MULTISPECIES: hypothetical protein [Acinetobacter]EXS24400.1 hypothetical protein J658_1273 [Acinetobacter baumannii 573719]EHU2873664.1 hypothetical protein [Acinetobacter baumannii]EHU2876802.1 hypothetical protein [Acinetobacter baumannii]EHU2968416.1 hypothetical protein [Acinetobacter baumannii]EHU2971341.1 hypothetical protein [Acinetobacter baumannii]